MPFCEGALVRGTGAEAWLGALIREPDTGHSGGGNVRDTYSYLLGYLCRLESLQPLG
jgi:hypothetical protein